MKVLLVMDMPKRCYECPFCNDDAECDVIGRHFDVNPKIEKPDWCPLRQMPEKKPEYLSINSKKGYCDGWNACIDAIGGGDSD